LIGLGAFAFNKFSAWRAQKSSAAQSGQSGRVTVGSKDFTESVLLAEIVAQMLEARGVEVERQFELAGNLTHTSLTAGRIDCYPEYTGTAYTAILQHQPTSDPRAVYDQVKREYEEKFNAVVSEPLGFENTFAILMRGDDARRLKLKTISDVAPLTPKLRAGFGQDFMSRADGYAGFARAYDLKFAEKPREMDLSLTYVALASNQVDIIAGNSTEGRIATLDLFQLEDDRRYFPPYEAVFLARRDTVERVPALREVLSRLSHAISTEEMRRLNYQIDGEKLDRREVVGNWLKSKGL
jgi:glycine betaine/choline ABC-type transport system substrate-binding protein